MNWTYVKFTCIAGNFIVITYISKNLAVSIESKKFDNFTLLYRIRWKI